MGYKSWKDCFDNYDSEYGLGRIGSALGGTGTIVGAIAAEGGAMGLAAVTGIPVTHLFDITVLANLRSQGFRQSVRIGIANGFQIATLWS
jgi:hypothetical protein